MHMRNPTLFRLGAWDPFAGVLFAGERRKIQCGRPSLERSRSPWCAQGGIGAQNSFGSVPRASRVYFEKFHRSNKQQEVIKWTRVPASYQRFLRTSWVQSNRAPLLGGQCCQPPPSFSSQVLSLQASGLLPCLLLHPTLLCLFPWSGFLKLHVFPHFAPFLAISLLLSIYPCCYFCFHACEMALLDPYVHSFLA